MSEEFVQICKFCQREAPKAPLPGYENGWQVYFCEPCQAEYVYNQKGWANPATIHLYVLINDKMYRWTTVSHNGSARLYYIKWPGVPGEKINRGLKQLQFFQDIGQTVVTPDNIEEKIKIMLMLL